jgi:hypothetical protein
MSRTALPVGQTYDPGTAYAYEVFIIRKNVAYIHPKQQFPLSMIPQESGLS